MKVMIDAGATNTIITENALRKTKHQKFDSTTNPILAMADGTSNSKVLGMGHQAEISIHNPTSYPCFLKKGIILDYSHLFDTSKITVSKTEVSHVINTKPHSPPCSKCYPMSKQKEDALYDILMELMNAGFISKAKSPYAAPALLTPKSDGSLTNSPPTFQRVMSTVLQSCRQFCPVYLDDIIIFSSTVEEHLDHLQKVLECLNRNNLKLDPLKCSIVQSKINYLDHTITASVIIPWNDKINAILKLKEPRTLKQANHFIGALSWYRKFIPRFAEVAASIHAITNLTKKNRHKFKWNQKQSQAFYELKKMLTTARLLLQFPDDSKPLILSTDASNLGVGGVL
ncbi:unnamed protein product, partial [Didymodactylos carnosus]